MNKGVATAVAVLALGGVGFGIMQAFGGRSYRLAEAAPAHTTVWLEARDLAGTLEAFRKGPTFGDYERSATRKKVDEAWKQLLTLNDSPAAADLKALGLSVSEESLLLTLGKNVGLGLLAGPEPSAFVATRVDLVGLAKAVAVDGEWTKVWERLRGTLGGADATVEPYQGFDLVTRKAGRTEVHFSMAGEVLVASLDKDTVKAVLDVRAGARASLADQPAFRSEVKALPGDVTAYAWVDMQLVRDRERLVAAVKRTVERLGEQWSADAFDGEELSVLLADLAPLDGLAFGLQIPKGDLYQASVVASRAEAALFRDTARHDLRGLLDEHTFLYVEARGLYDLGLRIARSETVAALQGAAAVRHLRALLEDPDALPPELRRELGAPRLEGDPTFEGRLALNAAAFPLRELLGNDIALAVEAHEGSRPEEALRPLAFVRARPLARMAVAVASGIVAKEAKAHPRKAEVTTHAGRQVFCIRGPTDVYWAQVGAELAISTRKELIERVLDKAGQKGAAPGEFQRAIQRLPEGYAVFAYFDPRAYQRLVSGLGGPEAEQVKRLQGFMKGIEAQATAAYVDRECRAYTLRTWQQLGEGLDEDLRKAYGAAKDAPSAWARLPEETFLSVAGEVDAQALWRYALRLAEAAVGPEQVKEGLEQLGSSLLAGKDPHAALIAPLGGGLGFGLVSQPRLGSEDPDVVAVPAGVLAIELTAEGASAFEGTLAGLLEVGLKALNASAGGGRADDAAARTMLRQIAAAQALFREGDIDGDGVEAFGSLGDLAEHGLIDHELGMGVARGWQLELRASQDEWLCTARRVDAAPGDVTLVANHKSQVKEVAGRLPRSSSFELPEDAVPFGTLPREAPGAAATDDPRLARLAKAQVGGQAATRLLLPARQQERMERDVGQGVSPCYAIAGNWLYVATSEHALARALAAKLDQGSLAASPSFKALIAGHPTKALTFSHLSWAGLAEQALHNGERLARELAPLPAELRAKPRPRFPELTGDEDMDAVFTAFQAETEAWERENIEHAPKAHAWRKEHAAENARKLTGPVRELAAMLGGVLSYSTLDADGKGVESVLEVRLDPKPKAAAAN
ncbi:MAG: hypothetical protein KF878_16725 [Planctomycetes bacterium]|nr:hypothetical protein [Planctomycetota bacterium]